MPTTADAVAVAYQKWLADLGIEASPEAFRQFHTTNRGRECPMHAPCNFCHA